jgi:WD40 repeat protein
LHIDQVRWAEFSPDGEQVVTASADNHAGIWNIRTSRLAAPPLKHTRTVERAVFSPDGRRVATASLDRTARVWDAMTGQALTPPLWHDHPVSHICFSPDGRRLLTASWTGQARLWDSNTGRPLTELLNTGARYVFGACFDSTGDHIAVAGVTESARVWKMPTVPVPVPEWLPALAEAVAGTRLSARGNVEIVDRSELQAMADRFPPAGATEFYERLARWFFADPAQRAIDPF